MARPKEISDDVARRAGDGIGIDWTKVDLGEFRRGLEVELEHGAKDPQTNVTGDDMVLTGKIAWAHLKEFPDYYARLDRMEAEADAYWADHPRRRAEPGSAARSQ
jgi:hypothetical protein